MAQKKFDGVVEAVRYAPDGRVGLVRVYERRGAAFSDRILLTRDELIGRLQSKKRFFVGRRMPYLAGTFDIGVQLRLAGSGENVRVVTSDQPGEQDQLEGVPLF